MHGSQVTLPKVVVQHPVYKQASIQPVWSYLEQQLRQDIVMEGVIRTIHHVRPREANHYPKGSHSSTFLPASPEQALKAPL